MNDHDFKRFEVLTGLKTGDGLFYTAAIGTATQNDGEEYFTLRLWSIYPACFYLVKCRNPNERYMVFAKKTSDSDSGLAFSNPVGSAALPDDLKTHLEITMRYPRGTLYMSLFPETT